MGTPTFTSVKRLLPFRPRSVIMFAAAPASTSTPPRLRNRLRASPADQQNGACRFGALQVRRPVPPQAPTSAAVAKQILYHSEAVPVKRFDSADYELQKYKAVKQQAAESIQPLA